MPGPWRALPSPANRKSRSSLQLFGRITSELTPIRLQLFPCQLANHSTTEPNTIRTHLYTLSVLSASYWCYFWRNAALLPCFRFVPPNVMPCAAMVAWRSLSGQLPGACGSLTRRDASASHWAPQDLRWRITSVLTSTPCLATKFVRQPQEIKLPHLGRQFLESVCDTSNILPPLLIRRQIPVAVHIPPGRIR